jgi:hypothetical protein
MSMHASGPDRMSDDALERQLRQALYRFDCPAAQTLGEYELDVLNAVERTLVAAHVVGCEECTHDLHILRTFLATPAAISEPLTGRVRRMVAKLFTPRPGLAYGGLRGASDPSTRVYEAGDVTITLGPGGKTGSVLGLVVAGDVPPAALLARAVRLARRDGSAVNARLDELGNFEFDDVVAGTYDVEIDLPQGVVVIEDFRVG